MRSDSHLVHAHWCGEYALAAIASGRPTLISVHDWMPAVLRLTDARYWPHWSARTLLYFATLARARHLTANSPYTLEKIRPFTRGSLEVIPNGVMDSEFIGDPPAVDLDAFAGAPPIVLSVNNGFSPLKNVPRLLQAFHTARQRGLRCQLRLVGVGYEPGGLCATWARHESLVDGVVFLGVVEREQVLAEMRRAAVLVHPSREEAFGMTLVEAMSQRLPVIGGAHSGAVPWVLGGGKAGLLVDVRDVAALAAAIENVLRRPELRAGLSQAGFAHAWKHFRQSRVTDLFLAAYKRVLEDTMQARGDGGRVYEG